MEQNEPANPTPDNQPTSDIPPIVDSEPTPEEKAAAAVASKDDKTMAMLCHLLGLLTSFIGPLIIWLIKKDQSAYVDQQGKEALNFQITVAIAMLIASLSTMICIGFLLMPAIAIADLVLCIMAAVAANKGEPSVSDVPAPDQVSDARQFSNSTIQRPSCGSRVVFCSVPGIRRGLCRGIL